MTNTKPEYSCEFYLSFRRIEGMKDDKGEPYPPLKLNKEIYIPDSCGIHPNISFLRCFPKEEYSLENKGDIKCSLRYFTETEKSIEANLLLHEIMDTIEGIFAFYGLHGVEVRERENILPQRIGTKDRFLMGSFPRHSGYIPNIIRTDFSELENCSPIIRRALRRFNTALLLQNDEERFFMLFRAVEAAFSAFSIEDKFHTTCHPCNHTIEKCPICNSNTEEYPGFNFRYKTICEKHFSVEDEKSKIHLKLRNKCAHGGDEFDRKDLEKCSIEIIEIFVKAIAKLLNIPEGKLPVLKKIPQVPDFFIKTSLP